MKEAKSSNINVRITGEMKQRLLKESKESGMNLSNYIIYIINKHLRSK